MLAVLFMGATVIMSLGICMFVAIGARREVDLDYQSGNPPSALPAFLFAMVLMALQVALWFAMGAKFAGAW